ncbi:MAG: DUF3570 domain-containing protein [Saprospiraceae bacterium]
MIKISLSGLAFFLGMLLGHAQESKQTEEPYKAKPLKIEEVNLVSSYYSQNGNHSAVTGGTGSERLTDNSNNFDLKLLKVLPSGNKHRISIGIGFDAYTSASSDKIDTATNWVGFTKVVTQQPERHGRSGASSISSTTTVSTFGGTEAVTSASFRDHRFYPSIGWSMESQTTGLTIGAGLSYSTEYDYHSRGATFNIAKSSKSKNTDLALNLGAFLDEWLLIYPAELRPANYPYGGERDKHLLDHAPRNTFNTGLTFNQVINKRLQIGLMVEPSFQKGLLATKYQRVNFSEGSSLPENLPDKRLKLPMSFRASYFLSDFLVIRSYYRYYQDDWKLKAHTANLELALKVSPFTTLIPFYRYYTQNGVSYFAPNHQHSVEDQFYTSDYDLSKLSSRQFGLGVRLFPKNGVMGIHSFKELEIRWAHYERSTDLKSNIITAALTFK